MTDYLDSDTLGAKLTPRGYEGDLPALSFTQVGSLASITSLTNVNVSCVSAVSVGTMLHIYIASRELVTGVTDSKGNSYTVDRSAPGGATQTASIVSCVVANALTTSDTWTITYATANLRHAISCIAWTGAVQFLGPDQSAAANDTVGNARSGLRSGTTPVTTYAPEMVAAAFSSGGSPAGGNGAYVVSGLSSGGGVPAVLAVKYYLTNDQNTQIIAGLSSGGADAPWAGVAATYKVHPVTVSTDANTVPLALTASGVDLPSFTQDETTVKLNFTITAVEQVVHVYTDAATVLLTLNPATPTLDAGTINLKFTPSADEVAPPVVYTDVGTVVLLFDMAADDCHSILTPHWDVFISQRWHITSIHQRWHVTAVQNRWALWVIGIAIDNPCPEPEFPEQVFAGDAA